MSVAVGGNSTGTVVPSPFPHFHRRRECADGTLNPPAPPPWDRALALTVARKVRCKEGQRAAAERVLHKLLHERLDGEARRALGGGKAERGGGGAVDPRGRGRSGAHVVGGVGG